MYHRVLPQLVAILVLAPHAGALRADPLPVVATDMTPKVPFAWEEYGPIAPRFSSGVGNEFGFRVFFEDRSDGNRIKFTSWWWSDSWGFGPWLGLTNISDTHFCVKEWPIAVAGIEYAYRAWASVGDNPLHRFYVSNTLTDWILVSTFTIPVSASHPSPHGQVYYGFHDVIELNGTYYAWGETNEGQTDMCRSANGGDVWECFDVVGGVHSGPLLLPEPAAPSGSFFELGGDRGYGKIHFRGNGSAVHLAINTEAKPSLAPADLEAAFIDPSNWTWHDGTVGMASSPILSAADGHDWREGWLVPGATPSNSYDWKLIYDAGYALQVSESSLGWAIISAPPPGIGACCRDDGTCENLAWSTCATDRRGQWLGTDTDCTDGCPDCDCDGTSDWEEFWYCVQVCTDSSGGLTMCLAACDGYQCRTAVDPCDDNDPCTVDVCTGTGMAPLSTGCENRPLECSDGVECTLDGCEIVTSLVCEYSGDPCDQEEDCAGPIGSCSITESPCDSDADCIESINEVCTFSPPEACVEKRHHNCTHNPVDDRCDDGDACTIGECTSDGCLYLPAPDRDSDGCCDFVDDCDNDPKHGCGPGPDYLPDDGPCIDVAYRAIIRSERSGLDTVPDAASLPAEDRSHLQNGCFVIEIWVQERAAAPTSLACAFANAHWEGDLDCLPKWWLYHWNDTFDQFRSGTIDNNSGSVTNVGGCTLLQGVGVFPRWDRLVTLHYYARYPLCETKFHLTESERGASLMIGEVLNFQFDSTVLEVECLGSLYDMAPGVYRRSPPRIGPEDLSFILPCWLAGREREDLGDCRDFDFDCDGVVGPGDVSFFATAWLKGVCDDGIVVPACRLHCDTDDALGMGGGSTSDGGQLPWANAETIRSFGLEVPPDDWPGWAMDPNRGGEPSHPIKPLRATTCDDPR